MGKVPKLSRKGSAVQTEFLHFKDAAAYLRMTPSEFMRKLPEGLVLRVYTQEIEVGDGIWATGSVAKVLNASEEMERAHLGRSKSIQARYIDPICGETTSEIEILNLLFSKEDLDRVATKTKQRKESKPSLPIHPAGLIKATEDFTRIIYSGQQETLPAKNAKMLKFIVEHWNDHGEVAISAGDILKSAGLTNETNVAKEFKSYPLASSLIEKVDHGKFRLKKIPGFYIEWMRN